MPVREFVPSDIPQVVDLYWNFMAPRQRAVPEDLPDSFAELYFSNPLVESATPSFVYVSSSGEILGFLGVTCRRMSLSGEPVRVALGGNFVVHPKARSGFAAARLLGAYMAGNHDLLLSDSANDVSRGIMERLGFQLIYPLSIHWSRAVRPSRYAAYFVSRKMGPKRFDAFQLATKPLCLVADKLLSSFTPVKSLLSGTEMSSETLLECLVGFRKGYSLWPQYDLESLEWVLSFMQHRGRRGKYRRVAVHDEKQKIVGWYVYYIRPRGVAEVVQVGGVPEFSREIIRHLLRDAWEQGAIAVHGATECKKMADLSDEGCVFTCKGGWTLAYSRRPELIEVLQRGEGLLSRLDGEWCLDPG